MFSTSSCKCKQYIKSQVRTTSVYFVIFFDSDIIQILISYTLS